ncbi:MAG: hypothetical protein ACYCQJ_07160 [Nitrososphaerales archaeon]
MQFGQDDLAKYSFLPEAGDFIRAQGISITDLSSPEYEKVVKRAEERVVQSIKSTRIPPSVSDREVEIMSFPVSLMLVKSTNLEHLMARYALAEAIRVEGFLKKETNGKVIEELFKSSLAIELEHNTQSPTLPPFKIPIEEYVKRAVQFHKTEWKLVNRIAGNGKVYLSQDDLIRLIREEIRVMILNRLKEVRIAKLPQNLDSIVKKIKDMAPPPPQSPYTIIHIAPENYPPCVRKALDMLDKGENVPHYGRFLMATYLLSVGKSVDDIVALFPKAPDFKKNITRYQVEHLAGLKGGRTRYRVPSCRTLQTNQFCFKDPIKCYEITSPLQYPSRKSPEVSRSSGKARETKEKKRDWMKTRRK